MESRRAQETSFGDRVESAERYRATGAKNGGAIHFFPFLPASGEEASGLCGNLFIHLSRRFVIHEDRFFRKGNDA